MFFVAGVGRELGAADGAPVDLFEAHAADAEVAAREQHRSESAFEADHALAAGGLGVATKDFLRVT